MARVGVGSGVVGGRSSSASPGHVSSSINVASPISTVTASAAHTATLLGLLPIAEGNFQRIGEGSYLSADLQTASWFATDVIRNGARGVLFERSFINYALRAVEVGASWTWANGTGVNKVAGSTSLGTAPDASTPAVITYGLASNSRLVQTIGTGIPDGIALVLSGFFRGAAADNAIQPFINASLDSDTPVSNAAWTRLVKAGISGTAISDVVGFDNGNAWHIAHPDTNQVLDVWACCLNGGTYSMTPTRSLGSAFVSNPDVLTFLAAQVPLAVREAAWTVTVTPEWAPTNLVSGDERWIISFGGPLDGLRFRHTGSDDRLEAVVGGSVVASSNAVTGSLTEVARSLTIDPPAGRLIVNGDIGPAGTPWAWPGGVQARVGGILAGASEFDGYIL